MIRKLHHNAYRCRDSEETRALLRGLPRPAARPARSRSARPRRGRDTHALHTFYRLDDGSHLAFFETADLPFEFKAQHDFDLHIALEVDAPKRCSRCWPRARARGIECRGAVGPRHDRLDLLPRPERLRHRAVRQARRPRRHDGPGEQRRARGARALDGGQGQDAGLSDARAPVASSFGAADRGVEHRMIVERIWTGNAYRNYNYLIACPESGRGARDRSARPREVPERGHASRAGSITQILNTHEHHDHTGGNAAVVAATGAKVIAHHRAGVAHRRRGSRRQGGRRDQGRQDRRARVPGHARPHDVPHLPALARRRSRRSSRATRSSTPAPATATTAATPRTCTRPSSTSSRSCPTTRASTRATTTSRTTCASRSRASPTTPPRRHCCRG